MKLLAHLDRLRRRRAAGSVDVVDRGNLNGWAWNPRSPQTRLLVDVFSGGVFVAQALANMRRDDLAAAGIGDGCYGFRLDLKGTPFREATQFEAYVLPSRSRLPSAINREKPTSATSTLSLDDYLRVTFASWLAQPSMPPQAREMPRKDGRIARLFEPVDEPVAWGAAPSRYLDFIGRRWNAAERFDPTLSPTQFRAFLFWYLDGYGQFRGRMRAPLGAREIAVLKERSLDASPSFVRREFERMFAASKTLGGCAHDGEFQWRAFDSAVLGLDDIYSGDEDVVGYQSVDGETGEWPLSSFMKAWLRFHPVLRQMPTKRSAERARAWCAFVLFSASAPHLLLYAPPTHLRAFLTPDIGGMSPFDNQCAALFSCSSALKKWRAEAVRRQFDPDELQFTTRLPSGARASGPGIALDSAPRVDVQVIGPFSRAHGVGHSCRRLARALAQTGFSLRNCEFSQDHPNGLADTSNFNMAPVGRARVTILHLNLEDAPTTLAYAPDAFSDTHLVIFPYLETMPISAVQRFGLSLADDVFVATKYIADALAPRCVARVVGSAIEPWAGVGHAAARARRYAGLASQDDFVFLTAGDALSGGWRKNPIGAARAFRMAFPDDPNVKLIIKTHSTERLVEPAERELWKRVAEICAIDPRVKLLDSFLEANAHAELVDGADCLVSLHRSEGLGYHLLEAMAQGAPIIASDYSGSRDFCTMETAFLVSGQVVPIEPGQYRQAGGGQVWFEPHLASAARQMKRVRCDAALRERVARAGRDFVIQAYSSLAFADRLQKALTPLLAGC